MHPYNGCLFSFYIIYREYCCWTSHRCQTVIDWSRVGVTTVQLTSVTHPGLNLKLNMCSHNGITSVRLNRCFTTVSHWPCTQVVASLIPAGSSEFEVVTVEIQRDNVTLTCLDLLTSEWLFLASFHELWTNSGQSPRRFDWLSSRWCNWAVHRFVTNRPNKYCAHRGS